MELKWSNNMIKELIKELMSSLALTNSNHYLVVNLIKKFGNLNRIFNLKEIYLKKK
jgi:hypothetical protein